VTTLFCDFTTQLLPIIVPCLQLVYLVYYLTFLVSVNYRYARSYLFAVLALSVFTI